MPKVYEIATQQELEMLDLVIRDHYPELLQYEVIVALTFVSKFTSDDELVRCLKHHGNYAAAVISLTRTGQKIHVRHDAEILVDRAVWDDLPDNSKKAVLHHELRHLHLVTDKKTGVPKVDDAGRPKLRMRPDDFSLTGFYATIRAFGSAAVEHRTLRGVVVSAQIAELRFPAANQPTSLTAAGTLEATQPGSPGILDPDRSIAEQYDQARSNAAHEVELALAQPGQDGGISNVDA